MIETVNAKVFDLFKTTHKIMSRHVIHILYTADPVVSLKTFLLDCLSCDISFTYE